MDFSRIPARRIWHWWSIIPAYVGATALGYYLWVLTEKEISAQRLENSSATIAIMPLVIAEKDRSLLKNLRKMREEETELMKNVEGWETGTLYGEKIYNTLPENEFKLPYVQEYYAHAPKKSLWEMANFWHNF